MNAPLFSSSADPDKTIVSPGSTLPMPVRPLSVAIAPASLVGTFSATDAIVNAVPVGAAGK